MSKVLITGINGFAGQHLARELHAQDCEVIGTGHRGSLDSSTQNFVSQYFECDLTDPTAVEKLPWEEVDAVVSLAGLANVGNSFTTKAAEEYKRVNVGVLSTFCEVLVAKHLLPRVLAISSGAVYDPAQPMPFSESARLVSDGSPYAMSKIMMEQAADQFRAQGLDVVVVRPFNHSGPAQQTGFLIPDLYQKIRHAQQTNQPLMLGKLTNKRDFTDVRDVVKAYASLALALPDLDHTIYNVCSGHSVAGSTILDLLLKYMDATDIEIKPDMKEMAPSRPQSKNPQDLFGSYERLHQELGWQPTIPLEQTIADFVKWENSND